MSVQYTGRCAVQRGMFSTVEGYHEYTGGISWVRRGDIMINVGEGLWENNWICMETPVYWTSPGVLMISPISPHSSWYPPAVLVVSPHCTEHPPLYSWYPPSVLNLPRCTQWYPPVYWTSPGVLQRHYAGWLMQLVASLFWPLQKH